MSGKPPFERLVELANGLRSGQRPLLSFIDELEIYFKQREPKVLAFLPESERFERLRSDAERLLRQYPNVAKRPPLFGIPIGVKDIFHTEGFTTRAGSTLPSDLLQGEEAQSVRQLKAAGALILGKTVTTEFAYFAPGPTRNPYNELHTPGGSSSGSAAAVGARLCPLTLGTQTIGSINRPAAFCGAVGYKPSYDRISRAGVIPLAESVDHVGLFAPECAGIERVAEVLCNLWQGGVVRRKPVFGVPEGPYLDHASDEGRRHFRQLCRRLHDAGYAVKSVMAMTDFPKIYEAHQTLVAAEAARYHARWRDAHGVHYHPKTAELLERGAAVTDRQLQKARRSCQILRESLTQLMQKHAIDLWLSPPAPGEAPAGLESTGNPVMNLPWTHAGLPTLTLPAGRSQNNLPLGIQLTGRWFDDEALLGWGGLLETVVTPQ